MKNGYILVAMAGGLFATVGIFSDNLMKNGFTAEQVAFVRAFVGFSILAIYSLVKNINNFKISKKGIALAVLSGIICQTAFNIVYFKAIDSVGVSIAAVLLYTSPLFVALFSKVLYKEDICKRKKISLILCLIGALIAVTGGKLNFRDLNTVGVILGIGAAITYACMPIISKCALNECSSVGLIIYSFLFGAILMTPISKPWEIISHIGNFNILITMIGTGLFPAALAYICYVTGIEKGVELSRAGVICSSELIISAIIGWTMLGEKFSIIKVLGLCIMMISTIIATKSQDSKVNIEEANAIK